MGRGTYGLLRVAMQSVKRRALARASDGSSAGAAPEARTEIPETISPNPLLRQPNVMHGISPAQRNYVLSIATHRHFDAGDVLFAQDDPHDRIYIIETGLVRAFYTSKAGDEITLAYWQAGDLVGAPLVFGGGYHTWSCRAVAETCTLALRGAELRTLVQELPVFAVNIIEALSFKVQWLSHFVQRLGTQDVTERLASLLETLGTLHGVVDEDGTITIGTPFTHEDLAAMVSASRPWITAALKGFQERGIIRTSKRKLILLRPDMLSEIASGARLTRRQNRSVASKTATGACSLEAESSTDP